MALELRTHFINTLKMFLLISVEVSFVMHTVMYTVSIKAKHIDYAWAYIMSETLVSRPGLGFETVQDHFLVVLVLVSIGPVLVSVLVSNTGSKNVLVGLGHCMHGQALKGAFNNHCQSVEGLV
jgi:hypothetical protein